MKRRDFFAASATMLLPVLVDGMGVRAFTKESGLIQSLSKASVSYGDNILVIIYLNGGNDGLNTVIPLEHYSQYHSLRSNIAIPENKVLRLDGNDKTGLHPSMTGMREMYNQGKLAIINSVSYPNPNQSHYRSADIFMTGVDADKYSDTGWMGRYLENRFTGYPDNYPNETMEDPLAIQIGLMNSTSLLGSKRPMSISLESPTSFYRLMGSDQVESSAHYPCCDAGDIVRYIRDIQTISVGYSAEIKRAADNGVNLAQYPVPTSANDLSEQLKIVARLIHGGLKSKVYFVEMGGFDTHASQVTASNPSEGLHASLLKKLSDSIAAFQNDLKLQGLEDKVVGMTFSDFGRRASSNASFGTDHGVAAPMFVFGTGIKRQIVGTNPDLINDLVPLQPTPGINNQDIKMQIDFRRIYTDILRDWFGTDPQTTSSLLFRDFKTTSLFSNVVESVSSGVWPDRNIWSSGSMPGPNDYVKINPGHNVTLGQNVTVKNIQIMGGGELSFIGNYTVTTTG